MNFLPKALAMAGNLAFNASAFIFDEEDSEHPHLNKKGLDKDKLHLRVGHMRKVIRSPQGKVTRSIQGRSYRKGHKVTLG